MSKPERVSASSTNPADPTNPDHPPNRDGYTKRRPGAPAGFFTVEAAGLRWLAVPGGVPVAPVLAVDTGGITIGRVATTHDAGAAAFGTGPDGWSGDGYIGDAPLTLRPHATWGAFYAAERVLPYARTAARSGALSRPGLAAVEALAERLANGEFDDHAPPARLLVEMVEAGYLGRKSGRGFYSYS